MNKMIPLIVAGVVSSFDVRPAAGTGLFPWNEHAVPFTFLFGNEFDGHQLSRLAPDRTLQGLLYIEFTGTLTKDGYRVASHSDCNAAHCTVGWTFNGRPLSATLLSHEEHDHPLFLVDRVDIPQPGAFSHFHWLGELPMPGETTTGYVLQLLAVDRFCFIHHEAASAMASRTCRQNGGVKVNLGFDVASHANIVPRPPATM